MEHKREMTPVLKAEYMRDQWGCDHACHLAYRYRAGHDIGTPSWAYWNKVIRILEAEKKAMSSTAAERRKRRRLKEQKRRAKGDTVTKNE